MKYIIRAVKYFVQLMVILSLIIAILIVAKIVDSDISKIFVNGYDSLWQIALMMAAFAAIYPSFGYGRRRVVVPGADEEVLPVLDKVMTAYRYEREKRTDGRVCYRKASVPDRILRLWEDRISVERLATGFELEGYNRDVVRLVNALRDAIYE
ncbi:MAG: hypothetical protein J5695_07995 [Bacteroidales bacterium]|nr:hypothetical protein [Bacteroidales bacterium]